jgi:serine-type D-Ala-D-Ala carboxypeptidase (penicillin-binding protein 5/6)
MFQSLISLLLASTLSLASSASGLVAQDSFDDSTLLSVAPIPTQLEEYVAPGYMSAAAVIATDLESQSVLYESNSSARLPIASLTKLMTAFVILEENDTDDIVTVSSNAASTVGSSMGLYNGEQITIKNLLYGLLIESGNDSAVALAEYNAGSESAFVTKMNQKARELGMYNTNYANTTGLDSSVAYSSARDLALLSSHLAHDPSIREIVRQQSATVSNLAGTTHTLTSTNILLGQYGIKGLKTGKTPVAGECLITLAETPDGHEIITVVLGSGNRFTDSSTLVDWIYRAYIW